MNIILKKLVYPFYSVVNTWIKPIKLRRFYATGRTPWSIGYIEHKWREINTVLYSSTLLNGFKNNCLPDNYGIGVDERILEYPWIFSRLLLRGNLLDAGSTFNFKDILTHPAIKGRKLTIFTFFPEVPSFPSVGVEYVYGDLRQTPFQDSSFDTVVCHSTLEHVGMNNTLYGYVEGQSASEAKKCYDYLDAVQELLRVLKSGGRLLITSPYGKFENYDSFQQFDDEMLSQVEAICKKEGTVQVSFAKYTTQGWQFTSREDCSEILAHDPHSGRNKGTDGAAHSRSVFLLQLDKRS